MMIPSMLTEPSDHAHEAVVFFRYMGLIFGGIFAVALSAAIWVPDAITLAQLQAELPWAKLVLGLPITIVLCGLAGLLASPNASGIRSIIVWILIGGLMGKIISHMPYQGRELIAGLLTPDLQGEAIFPMGSSGAARTSILTFICAGMGLPLGILERLILEVSWEQTNSQQKITLPALALLTVSLPLALIIASAVNEQLYGPLQTPYQVTGKMIQTTLERDIQGGEGGRVLKFIEDYKKAFSEDFSTHLVQYQLDPPQKGVVDIRFQGDLTLRCSIINGKVIFCSEFSQQVRGWMENLIQFGLTRERQAIEAIENNPDVEIKKDVMIWIQAHDSKMGEAYTIRQQKQVGGYLYVGVDFENGFQMTCRFRGTSPVTIDRCLNK